LKKRGNDTGIYRESIAASFTAMFSMVFPGFLLNFIEIRLKERYSI